MNELFMDIENKAMCYNSPIMRGDIVMRDYVQRLAQEEDYRNALIITDAPILYSGMPDKNISVMTLDELDELNWNEYLIYELQEYLEKDGIILIRIFDDEDIELSIKDMINSLYAKTRGRFWIQLSGEIDCELKHHAEIDFDDFISEEPVKQGL